MLFSCIECAWNEGNVFDSYFNKENFNNSFVFTKRGVKLRPPTNMKLLSYSTTMAFMLFLLYFVTIFLKFLYLETYYSFLWGQLDRLLSIRKNKLFSFSCSVTKNAAENFATHHAISRKLGNAYDNGDLPLGSFCSLYYRLNTTWSSINSSLYYSSIFPRIFNKW